jgi:hypothetical protein
VKLFYQCHPFIVCFVVCQKVAIMMDTVATMSRIHSSIDRQMVDPLIVVTTSIENRVLKSIWSFWSPINLTLQSNNDEKQNSAVTAIEAKHDQLSTNLQSRGISNKKEITVGGWSVVIEKVCADGIMRKQSIVDYAVVQHLDRHTNIQWTERAD